MHQEYLYRRTVETTLATLSAPVGVLELRLPDLFVQAVDVETLLARLVEHSVLDEVQSKQRRPPCIERFEDHLGVVAWLKGDRDNLEQVTQCDPNRLNPFLPALVV